MPTRLQRIGRIFRSCFTLTCCTFRGFKELYLVCAEKTQHHAKKKTLTYKEQSPEKRQAYLDALALEVQGGGKTPVYVDESGFPTSELRRYAYAPRGVCVRDKISGAYRYKSTSLIAAHIGERLQLLCFFKVPVMRLLSMRG